MIRAAAAALWLVLAATPAAGQPPATGLTGGLALGRAYDAALNADFDDARRLRDVACPPAPAPACLVLDALITWWRIQLDPDDRRHDRAFESEARAAQAAAAAWTTAEPRRAEAWFYLGAAHGALAQWQILRGERLAAARQGRAIHDALTRALALDPALDDARFGLGLYQYFAGTAPRVLRMFRWLLLLPGGNAKEGLSQIERAYRAGGLVSSEAANQLHLIYLWYEQRFTEARALADELARRYPRSPVFRQSLAVIDDDYLGEPADSLRGWQALVAAAARGDVNAPHIATARARLGIASHLERLDESDRTIVEADAVLAMPAVPVDARSRAWLLRGIAHDRLGDRRQADADWRRAIETAPAALSPAMHRALERARQRRPSADQARAYRLSLEGWRAFERGDLALAWTRLDEARTLDRGSVVIRFRRAEVLAARGARGDALVEFDAVLVARPVPPAWVRVRAFMDAGTIAEAFGQRDRARRLFQQAADVHGADREWRARAAREAARLTP